MVSVRVLDRSCSTGKFVHGLGVSGSSDRGDRLISFFSWGVGVLVANVSSTLFVYVSGDICLWPACDAEYPSEIEAVTCWCMRLWARVLTELESNVMKSCANEIFARI